MAKLKTNKYTQDRDLFLTEIIGSRAYVQGRKIGKVKDLLAIDRDKAAEVTHFQIRRPFGDAPLLVPHDRVRSMGVRKVNLDIEDPESFVREPKPEEVFLGDYLLDKKVVDIEDREVEVVYDVRLAFSAERIYVVDVDISRYSLLVRLGMKWLARVLYKGNGGIERRLIPWSYIQPLPPDLGNLQGDLKLKVLREKLSDIHPVDLADILEGMDSTQRVLVLDGLETEHASETLEEIDPAVQRDIVFSLRKERVAQLIAEMTPGQAADLLSILPSTERRTIRNLLEPGLGSKIDEIIDKQDTEILNFATSRFFKCPPETTAGQVRNNLRQAAGSIDVLMYFYIVDESDKLLGVVDIRDVFMADDDARLQKLMVENIISLNRKATMKQAADMFLRYGFRAIPVTDEREVILGVVPYRDVMNLKHRILE